MHPFSSARLINSEQTSVSTLEEGRRSASRMFSSSPRSRLFSGSFAPSIPFTGNTAGNDRFDIEPNAFLNRHHIKFFLQDAIQQLGEDCAPSKHIETIAAYFQTVISGTHVFGRDFEYISATPHNRRSFVHLVETTFPPATVNKNTSLAGTVLSVPDCHTLLRLLCPDFPLTVTEEAARAAKCSVAVRIFVKRSLQRVVPAWRFEDFLSGLRITFTLTEFLEQARATIFTPAALWSSSLVGKCLGDFRLLMEKIICNGQEVPSEEVVEQALSLAFHDESNTVDLSQFEVFIGSLCNNEVMSACYKAEVSSFSAHAATYAAANALSSRLKRVEIINVSQSNTTSSGKVPIKRSKSASRRRPN